MKKRTDIDARYKWRLDHIYASDDLWRADYDKAASRLKDIPGYAGRLKEPQVLLEFLKTKDETEGLIMKLYVYARMRMDEDTGNSHYQGLTDMMESMSAQFDAEAAFFEPELMSLDGADIDGFLAQGDDSGIYTHYLNDKLRLKEHTLKPELEKLLAQVSELTGGPGRIFTVLDNADMKFGEVTGENGEKVELTHGRYGSLIRSANRDVRSEAYRAYLDGFIKQKNTIAAIYASSVKGDVFFSKTKKFASSMEAALKYNAIPAEVYGNLIATVNANLGLLHRYTAIRKKILGVTDLHMYDMYTPIAIGADTLVDYDDACETVLKALAPLGKAYCDTVEAAFTGGWIDVYESEGKRSGGYQWGEYGTHPFILLNYDGRLGDMFTLAHELGHAMHSYYTRANQPRVYGHYRIFVAEVASTVNEALLTDYLLKTTPPGTKRKLIINNFLDQFRGTMFRQTMFAEFELKTHGLVERGEPLTLESLNRIYGELNRNYFGDDVVYDEGSEQEWSRIPHFYRAFYVYQYATGFSAAIALSKRILADTSGKALEDYLGFLSGGSSMYPVDLLKKAGVDMSTAEPVEAALKVFDEYLTMFENEGEL